MRIALLGMHRSGTNVIGQWLLRQQESQVNLKLIDGTDWLEYDGKTDSAFISQVNHPEHQKEIKPGADWKTFIGKSSVTTVEREGLQYFGDFCHEHSYSWGGATLVIRDFRNWLASCYKMNGGKIIPHIDIMKYQSHLEALTTGQVWFKLINYNLWCKSKSYRWSISRGLKLHFTDQGFNDVPKNGGGSSFDGRWFDKSGSKMKTDQRYKEFESDVVFQQMLKRHRELVELSDEWIYKVE